MCGNCQTLFCGVCINQYLSVSEMCPFCKIKFSKAPIPRYINNILNSISLYCPFSCGEVLHMNNIRNHFPLCKNYGIEYYCKTCQRKIRIIGKLEDGLRIHLSECKEISITCENCKMSLKRWEYEDHNIICEKDIKKCEKCLLCYPKSYSNSHSIFCGLIRGLK